MRWTDYNTFRYLVHSLQCYLAGVLLMTMDKHPLQSQAVAYISWNNSYTQSECYVGPWTNTDDINIQRQAVQVNVEAISSPVIFV